MQQFESNLRRLNIVPTTIGKLPLVNGSYLSNRRLTQQQLVDSLVEERKQINSLDIQCARNRLAWEMKKNSLRGEIETKKRRFSQKSNIKTEASPPNSSKQIHVIKLSQQIRIKTKYRGIPQLSTRSIIQNEKNISAERKESSPNVVSAYMGADIPITLPKPLTVKNNRKKIIFNIDQQEQSGQPQGGLAIDTRAQSKNVSSIKSQDNNIRYKDSKHKKLSIVDKWRERQRKQDRQKSKRRERDTIETRKGQYRRWQHQQYINLQNIIQLSDDQSRATKKNVDSLVLKHFH